jgi:putative sigma-54 modulation protein
MRIDIRFRGDLKNTAALREHVLRSAHFQLGRFGQALSEVVVRVSDVNGPRGGVDKRCQVMAKGARIGTLAIDELNGDAKAAIDLALDRASHRVGQQLERSRAVRRTALMNL